MQIERVTKMNFKTFHKTFKQFEWGLTRFNIFNFMTEKIFWKVIGEKIVINERKK